MGDRRRLVWMPSCRQAVIGFRFRHGISEPIEMIDLASAYWVKSKNVKVNVSEWLELKRQLSQNEGKHGQNLFSVIFFGAVNIISFLLGSVFCCRNGSTMPFSVVS